MESSAEILTALLKDTTYHNLVVIGAGLFRFRKNNGITSTFQDSFNINELAMTSEDKDFLRLVEEIKALKVASIPQIFDDICKYILKRCGGHAFPALRFIEFNFTDSEGMVHTKDMTKFLSHFNGPIFANSDVVNRWFGRFHDPELYDIADRGFGGRGTASDINSLKRIAWWKDNEIISNLFHNVILSTVGETRLADKQMHLRQK